MTVLELAETLAQRSRDVERTVQLMETLQNILEKTTPANSLRDLVLRSFYMHIDSEDERVLVAIARAMLTVLYIPTQYIFLMQALVSNA